MPQVHYSHKLAKMICDEIANGLTLKQVHEKYKTTLPSLEVLWKWQTVHEKYKELYDAAQEVFYNKLQDEYVSLIRSEPPLGPDDDKDAYKLWKDEYARKKAGLEFLLKDLGKFNTKKFNTKTNDNTAKTNKESSRPVVNIIIRKYTDDTEDSNDE